MNDQDPPQAGLPYQTGPSQTIAALRQEMPVCQSLAYFDHAAVGPLPARSAEAIAQYANESSRLGDTCWPEWSAKVELLRGRLAEMLEARPAEIALVPNTTTAIGLVAEGWRWREGENVVVPANEFPSNLAPWRQLARRGVEVREIAVPASGRLELEPVLAAIDSSTRIVALSWVGFASGWRIDVARFCEAIHQRGALVSLDAIQGLGAFPLSVVETGVDFVAADGHKWMLGPEGAGVLFVRDEHLEKLDPLLVGWHSLEARSAFDSATTELKKTAARFEGGSANMPGLLGLERSIALLLEYGCHRPGSGFAEAILRNVAELEELLRSANCEVFLPAEPEHRSGILSVNWPGADLAAARKFCLTQGIVTSVRAGRLRVSTHAVNNSDDAGRLVAALKDFMRGHHG
jgi:selenocysteine lyase/cysteine desulfurase